MPKCPVCGEELNYRIKDRWLCECGEFIPLDYAEKVEKPGSCDLFNECR